MNENAKLIAKFLSVLPSLPEFLFNNLTSNQTVKSPQTTDDHDIPSLIRLLSLWWVRSLLKINFMSWEAMEVSMGKTRTGKYTESDICAFTQVQYVVCLPIQFFTYSSNYSYPMRRKSFSFYRKYFESKHEISFFYMDWKEITK